jgi:hypothetical protein
MAYLYADTANKVGYRPYSQTDPFGAAHLSGYGSGLGQNHPFKPQAWHLHGEDGSFLGTYHLNRPFDPWELYDDVHHTAGLHGLSGLGDGTDPVAAAADELLAAGHITQAEHDAILDGSMTFQDVVGIDPTDQGSWADFVGDLRDWNSQLTSLETQFQQAGPQPGNAAFAQLGQQLIQQRNQYSSIASQFVKYYTALIGSTPSGLSGLGVAVVVYWAVGAAAFLVTAFLIYQGFKTWQASINVNAIKAQTAQTAAMSTSVTNQSLTAALAAAQAAGDTVTAQSILKTLAATGAQPAAASPFEAWIMANWTWLALAGGALIMIGPITSGLFGGRRR